MSLSVLLPLRAYLKTLLFGRHDYKTTVNCKTITKSLKEVTPSSILEIGRTGSFFRVPVISENDNRFKKNRRNYGMVRMEKPSDKQ